MKNGKIILGNDDMNEMCSNGEVVLYDERTIEFMRCISQENYAVDEVFVKECGDIIIHTTNGCCVEVFVNSTSDAEMWRFFRPGTNIEHIVMNGNGLDTD